MHRKPLLDLLERYLIRHPEDLVRVDHVRRFVRTRPDCFERSCAEGHVTGSAWVVSHDRARVLLTHHRKLGRWLQLGGHADGEPDALRVALDEAREESGLEQLEVVTTGGEPLPLDVDVVWVPQRGDEAAHLHHDIRFLLVAGPGQPVRASSESFEVRWFDLDRVDEVLGDPGLRRLARRSRERLLGGAQGR